MKNKSFIIGVVILTIGWLVSLNIYLILFGVPVFLVGVIIVWFSAARLGAKLLATILPIVFWFPAMLLLLALIANLSI